MAHREAEHESMKFHPKQPAAKKYVYSPIEDKKCLPIKEAKEYLATGEWYASPADFPVNVAAKKALDAKKAEKLSEQQKRNANAKRRAAEKLAEDAKRAAEAAQKALEDADALDAEAEALADSAEEQNAAIAAKAEAEEPVTEEARTGDADGDSEEEEGPQEITLPSEATDWSKEQLEDFVVTNNLNAGKGLDLRKSKAKIFDEVIALIQDYNATL